MREWLPFPQSLGRDLAPQGQLQQLAERHFGFESRFLRTHPYGQTLAPTAVRSGPTSHGVLARPGTSLDG